MVRGGVAFVEGSLFADTDIVFEEVLPTTDLVVNYSYLPPGETVTGRQESGSAIRTSGAARAIINCVPARGPPVTDPTVPTWARGSLPGRRLPEFLPR